MQNKKQELIEYIQSQIPEIMELKKGCVFVGDVGDEILQMTILCELSENKEVYDYKVIDESNEVFDASITNLDKIIGRPINLEDILRVIPEYDKKYICCNSFGHIAHIDELDHGDDNEDVFGNKHRGKWQLGKDLNNQSEETINFLHELLLQTK